MLQVKRHSGTQEDMEEFHASSSTPPLQPLLIFSPRSPADDELAMMNSSPNHPHPLSSSSPVSDVTSAEEGEPEEEEKQFYCPF
jgi:hypothetical protein